jgi:hypothetical protein
METIEDRKFIEKGLPLFGCMSERKESVIIIGPTPKIVSVQM